MEGLMLKLKLKCFGYLMQRPDSFEKTLMLGKLKVGGEGWDDWMVSLTQRIWLWVNPRGWWCTGGLVCCSSRSHKDSLSVMDMPEWLNWKLNQRIWSILIWNSWLDISWFFMICRLNFCALYFLFLFYILPQ